MFALFKYLHVLTVVAAVVVALIPELMLHAVARTGDVAAIRGLMRVIERIARWVAPLFLLAAAFGFAAVFTGQFDPFRPWLIASYVVFVLAMGVGAMVSGPWAVRVGAAAADSPARRRPMSSARRFTTDAGRSRPCSCSPPSPRSSS